MVQKHQKMPNTEKHNFQGLPTLKKHIFCNFLNFCELPKKYFFLCLETMKNVFFDVLKPSNFAVSTCDFEGQNLGKLASPGKCIFCWFPGRPQRYPTLSVLIPDPNQTTDGPRAQRSRVFLWRHYITRQYIIKDVLQADEKSSVKTIYYKYKTIVSSYLS